MKFKEIIGQQEIINRLTKSVDENRVSHALLFSGPAGTGKLAISIAFAQYLSCTDRQANDSCGNCPSCKKYEKLIHPDLHFVFPVVSVPKFEAPVSDNFISDWRELILQSPYITLNQWLSAIDAENKQGIINKNESVQILRKLNLKSFESEFKIMIIWQADKMNATAANKLLKLIEEPPEKTIFILITDSQDQILQTILSRTQIIGFKGIDNNSLSEKIRIEFGLSENEAEHIVKLSSGSYPDARNLINENEQNIENFKYFTQLMRLAYKKDVIELQNLVDQISSIGREKQKLFLKYSLHLIRENFIYGKFPDDISFLYGEELDFSKKFSSFIKSENISELYEEFNNAVYHIERNGYPKLIFFDLGIKLVSLLRA